jgi:hypothetical protein
LGSLTVSKCSGNLTIGSITILNSTLEAITQFDGIGIGINAFTSVKSSSPGMPMIKNLTILNSNVAIINSSFEGIGTGNVFDSNDDSRSMIGILTISNSRIESPAKIGNGKGASAIENLWILGNNTLLCPSVNASRIVLLDSPVVTRATDQDFFETNPSSSESIDLTILFSEVTTIMKSLSQLDRFFLQFGNVFRVGHFVFRGISLKTVFLMNFKT